MPHTASTHSPAANSRVFKIHRRPKDDQGHDFDEPNARRADGTRMDYRPPINPRYSRASSKSRQDMDHLLTQMRGLAIEHGLASKHNVRDSNGNRRTLYVMQALDSNAAHYLSPLRLTAKNPFASNTLQKDNADCEQNFLSLLPSDLCAAVLTMITGLSTTRTMAMYRSLRSPLSRFDVERARGCSVYASQAYFVERYRQNLFDEKYKAIQQTQRSRASPTITMSLLEFQRDRERRLREKRSGDGDNVNVFGVVRC